MFGSGTGRNVVVSLLGLFVVFGCSRDVHLAGRKIPHVKVGPVTIDGVTLDKKATPEQVAFAALRAIVDDVKAPTPQDREDPLARQFDLCAANVIAKYNRSSYDRDEFIYNVVYRWSPTVSFYINDFPKTQAEAERRFIVRPVSERDRVDPESEEIAIAMTVTPSEGDAHSQVIMMIWLARDEGLWRVVHFGFDQQRRSLTDAVRQTSLNSSNGS